MIQGAITDFQQSREQKRAARSPSPWTRPIVEGGRWSDWGEEHYDKWHGAEAMEYEEDEQEFDSPARHNIATSSENDEAMGEDHFRDELQRQQAAVAGAPAPTSPLTPTVIESPSSVASDAADSPSKWQTARARGARRSPAPAETPTGVKADKTKKLSAFQAFAGHRTAKQRVLSRTGSASSPPPPETPQGFRGAKANFDSP